MNSNQDSSSPPAPSRAASQYGYASPELSTYLPRREDSPSLILGNLPYRKANPAISSLFASTSSLPGSTHSSGSSTPNLLASSVFSPGGHNGTLSPTANIQSTSDEPRNLIFRAFVPHVGVLASADTEEILQQKGFKHGFLELIRPFGEKLNGKITIRNSVGASTTWDDFGVRFTGVRDGLGLPRPQSGRASHESKSGTINSRLSGSTVRSSTASRMGGDVAAVEELVDKHLSWAEMVGPTGPVDYLTYKERDEDVTPKPTGQIVSPFYTLYLRRLLSGLPMTPHETFSHPVACVIAISSRSPDPIAELKRLYTSTNTGEDRLPQWVNNEFLRYYVLVHDEDHDDIVKSTALYEQMRRNFGLHCHLLRLRSVQCVPSDDDSVRLPQTDWLSAPEELAEIQSRELADDDEDPTPYIFESDVTAIRTFIRELVAQSIVPSMERNCAQWNEQVAARRRGLGGRLMSLGRKFTAFGGRNSSSPIQNSSTNYDSLQGFYRPDAPEAVMRKLGDYAFMLRDFRLAQSTYNLCITDFDNDKAWKHYAGANEMAAVSTLLAQQAITSKSRAETIDRMLESATHSYIHRSVTPYYALRGLAMAVELLKLRGSSATDDAARWGGRLIEAGLVGEIGQSLFKERIGACYSSRQGIGSMSWGRRRRKAGLWSVMAAQSFMRIGKTVQAEKCLAETRNLYGVNNEASPEGLAFEGMWDLLDQLQQDIVTARLAAKGFNNEEDLLGEVQDEDEQLVEEVSESLDVRPHRRSTIQTANGGLDPLGVMTEPLSPVKLKSEMMGGEEGFQ